ncbi:MAG: hypothetical protein GY822_29430 [Deltaproteobacteria bacterium]|nr:hypothetical protein [Deltaproteobacteria bacterium]
MTDDQSIIKNILGLGEERMGEVVGQLMSNEGFVNAMQGALSSSLAAKRSVDKNMERVFTFWNVPTTGDLEQVQDKVNELDDIMKTIQDRLLSLDERLEDKARTEHKKKKAAAKAAEEDKATPTKKAKSSKKTAAKKTPSKK